MVKNLALTASIIALVAISGQAFARATGSNLPERASSSDQQVVVPTYNAYDAFNSPMTMQTVESNAYRYHGGPKSND